MHNPKILDRVKKCLALASSSNPHEAAAALRQAQKLMQMHGLTSDDVELGAIEESGVKSAAGSTCVKTWEGHLARAVGDAFGVEVLWAPRKGGYGSYILIGPTSDVAVASHTFTVLQRLALKARAAYLRTLPLRLTRGELTANGDAFCMGWVAVVIKELERFTWTEARRSALQRYVARRGSAVSARQNDRSTRASSDAALAGARAARDVRLRRAATGKTSQSLNATHALEHVAG